MRDAGTIRERIFQALIKRYTADQEEALVKIDALLKGEVVPGHYALTEDIDKLLAKVASAAEKMATLRRFYGTNQALTTHAGRVGSEVNGTLRVKFHRFTA